MYRYKQKVDIRMAINKPMTPHFYYHSLFSSSLLNFFAWLDIQWCGTLPSIPVPSRADVCSLIIFVEERALLYGIPLKSPPNKKHSHPASPAKIFISKL